MILAVPVHVIDAAVAAVLRADPGERSEILWRQGLAFRRGLRDQGCPVRVAEAYQTSFERAVSARVDRAPGKVIQ